MVSTCLASPSHHVENLPHRYRWLYLLWPVVPACAAPGTHGRLLFVSRWRRRRIIFQRLLLSLALEHASRKAVGIATPFNTAKDGYLEEAYNLGFIICLSSIGIIVFPSSYPHLV